jgi:hypothetical protein
MASQAAGIHGYIGIDFGTSNSHIAYCNVDGPLIAAPICLNGKETSVPTCVLWREPAWDESEIFAFGSEAVQEWSDREDRERQGFRFATGFKPDIVTSERAARDAWGFLRKSFLSLREKGVVRAIGRDAGMPVVVGVPAEVGPEFRAAISGLARDAGFGAVTCIEEPLGALAYHLASSDITAAEARQGVVVVDFGGGTLDVALLDQRGLRRPWGDPTLGGRLFDDLFFRWLLDQNPGKSIDPGNLMFAWQVTCRELKEDFSRRWQAIGEGMDDFRKRVAIGESNWLFSKASVAEFYRRSREYRPSAVACDYFAALRGDRAWLGDAGPIDLLDRIERTMTPPGDERLQGRFARVLLTGGSSEWPFMKAMAAGVFGVGEDRIIRSAAPEMTIGSGLAIYNMLARRYEAAVGRLRAETPERRWRFDVDIRGRIVDFARQVTRAIVDPLMDRVEARFLRWRNDGGSLRAVEAEIKALCDAAMAEVPPIVAGHSERLAHDLLGALRTHLSRWLLEHDIQREVDQFLPDRFDLALGGDLAGGDAANSIALELARNLAASLAALAATITLIVVTYVHAAWFLVDIITATVALVASVLGFSSISDHIKEKVKEHDWGSWLGRADLRGMQIAVSETRLKARMSESRRKASDELVAKIEHEMDGLRAQAVAEFQAIIEQVITDLGFLDRIRTDPA